MSRSLCLSRNTRRKYAAGGFDVYQCFDCSHRFVTGLTDDELTAYYGRDYFNGEGYEDYVRDMEGRRSTSAQRLAEIEKLHPTKGTLLDYGCAIGIFVKEATQRGWIAVGYERSAWAVEYARDVMGVSIVLGGGRDGAFGESSFDVVTAWDVLEHLASPVTVLREIASWLKPGGMLSLNTVDASSLGACLAGDRWRHLTPPWHLQYFTRRSLRRLLESSGLRIVRRSSTGTLCKSRQGHRRAGAMVDRVARYWRLRGIISTFGLLDEQVVWARKLKSPC